jgi:NADH:ubiquinone oxidoreductase subunit D
MELFERVSGARMHTALYRPYYYDWSTLTRAFFLDIARFLMRCGRSLSGAVMGLLNNRILKSRLGGVGMLSTTKVTNYGISGIIARSAGFRKDLRLGGQCGFYGAYWHLSFRTFLGRRGDNLDRFLLRVKEVFESFRLIGQVVAALSNFLSADVIVPVPGDRSQLQFPSTTAEKNAFVTDMHTQFFNVLGAKSKFTGMEELIAHFRYFSEGPVIPSSLAYCGVESPKGELGVMLVSGGANKPYRVKIRTPVSHNMHLIPSVCVGFVFGDFVMTFCSLDIVLGEIDR